MLILSVYVDDIPSAYHEEDRAEWEYIKKLFYEKYKIKFLGDADWLLNMKIKRDRKNKLLFLDQINYIDNLLEEFNLDESHSVSHPGSQVELNRSQCPVSEEDQLFMSRVPYRRVIGLLTYLSNISRPDIAYSVNLCAQFAQNPGEMHWKAVMQILRYLCGTKNYVLCFDGNMQTQSSSTSSLPTHTTQLIGYADASWGSCPDTRRSTTGWILKCGKSIIDWNVHKQETVAISSCEAEYMSIVSVTQAIKWTKNLLKELGFYNNASSSSPFAISSVPIILSDNKSAIAIGLNDTMHNRSKHIDIKHHFIRDEISSGTINIQWISTHDQIADILTKKLDRQNFIKFRDQLVRKI
jgi:hypothetical protein